MSLKHIMKFTVITIFAVIALSGCGGSKQAAATKQTAFTDTTLTDERDGKTYRVVRIGKLAWMAENLNYITATTATDSSWCYDYADSNCVKYGRLYNWDTAMKACPEGWRLPTREDWNNLVKAAGGEEAGKKLKSNTGWTVLNRPTGRPTGTDDFGFSALPGGSRSCGDSGGRFFTIDKDGTWWSATETEHNASKAWFRLIETVRNRVGEGVSPDKGYGFSVRCVRE